MSLVSLVFRVQRGRLEAVKELARETRVRQSEYLREALDDLLKKHEDKLRAEAP